MKILVIAGIHGNAEALRAVMQIERDAEATIFLGDAFNQWLRDGLLNGHGIGEREPWTRFAAEGFS